MGGEWRETTVGELADSTRNALVGGPFGSNLVSRDYVSGGVPVIRGQNMGGRWVSGDFAFVSAEKARALEANLAKPGDIVFTQRGTLGQVSMVPNGPFDRYLVSQSQMKLTVNRKVADPHFFYYVFSGADQQDYVRQHAIQTGVPHINLGILRSTPVPLPPLPEQRLIALVLGALDDKIELNRRMSETLEAMARALFKSWFVDSDPVRAKAEGRDTGLPGSLAKLFPDAFEQSKLGTKPAGWPVRNWGEVSSLEYGRSLRDAEESQEEAYRVFGTNGPIGWTREPLCPHEGVIIGRKGAYRGIHYSASPFWVIDTAFYLEPRTGLENRWAYYALRLVDLNGMDSGSAIPSTSRSDFYGMRAVIPPAEIQRAFVDQMGAAWRRQAVLLSQSDALAALRDNLLPKLISGELRIPDAERIVGEVA